MPCLQRIEIPGAATYVNSRSNYRKEFFLSENTGTAFERTILETIKRCIWKLHAYVIMSHHYHLTIETPEPNLVEGMKWLQRTFSTWFNRLRNVCGYVFQGRTKSILIGEGRARLGRADYIHRHPVRAGLGKVKSPKGYERSSFPKYFNKSPRAGHCREGFLGILALPDSPAGLRRDAAHLGLCEEQDPPQQQPLDRHMPKYGTPRINQQDATKIIHGSTYYPSFAL